MALHERRPIRAPDDARAAGAGQSAIAIAIDTLAPLIGGEAQRNPRVRSIDPVAEDAYWRKVIDGRPYFDRRMEFERDYAPAYALGYLLRSAYPSMSFRDARTEYSREWPSLRGRSRLEWNRACGAFADAWDRYTELNALPDPARVPHHRPRPAG